MCEHQGSEKIQERLIGIGELAELLSCKPQTIRNKLSLGKFAIPTYKLLGSDMLLNQCLNLKIHYTTCDDSVVIRS